MNQFCIVIPNYNHTHAIAAVLDELKELQLPIIMVDDGSDADAKQVFAELNSEFNFGKEAEQDENFDTVDGSFANNSLNLTPGVFLSYFPSQKFTVLGLIQHSQRIDTGNDFSQDFTAVGGGAKYQLNKALNIEALYTNFVRGNNTGLGQTFNIGLRALF